MEDIVKVLSQECLQQIDTKFTHFKSHFKDISDDQRLLLTQKGVYPYDYMNTFEKFKDKSFPSIEECYSQLNKENMTEYDYDRAIKVWKSFDVTNM